MSPRPTLRQVVFFTAKDPADLPQILAGLNLLADIPHASHFAVRENTHADTLSGRVDVVVYAEFASAEDLAAYKAHPLYQKAIDAVRPLRDMRVAADF